jgi:hypothetical protein
MMHNQENCPKDYPAAASRPWSAQRWPTQKAVVPGQADLHVTSSTEAMINLSSPVLIPFLLSIGYIPIVINPADPWPRPKDSGCRSPLTCSSPLSVPYRIVSHSASHPKFPFCTCTTPDPHLCRSLIDTTTFPDFCLFPMSLFKHTLLYCCFSREFDIVYHSSFHLLVNPQWHSHHSSSHS